MKLLKSEVETPILILGFNRPEDMLRLIEALRLIKPTRIYFAVDGPRNHVEGEKERVLATRNLIKEFTWPSKIESRFLETNVGCKVAISSAINWFFEKEDYGIILEDDCIPTLEFITFATRMLDKYKNEERVMHISANSFFPDVPDFEFNHYFSRLPGVWGWATWKRAWNKFEFTTQFDSTISADEIITDFYQNKAISKWFIRYYRESLSPNASAWSPHWIFSMIRNNGLSVTPMANLVQNIGFTSDSTHASSKSFQAFNDFKIGGLPDLPDPEDIAVENFLDKLRFQVTRKTDPNLFIMRRAKIFILPKIYSISSPRMKKRVKKVTSRRNKLKKFLQE